MTRHFRNYHFHRRPVRQLRRPFVVEDEAGIILLVLVGIFLLGVLFSSL